MEIKWQCEKKFNYIYFTFTFHSGTSGFAPSHCMHEEFTEIAQENVSPSWQVIFGLWQLIKQCLILWLLAMYFFHNYILYSKEGDFGTMIRMKHILMWVNVGYENRHFIYYLSYTLYTISQLSAGIPKMYTHHWIADIALFHLIYDTLVCI